MKLLQPTYFKKIAGQQLAFYESPGKGETLLLVHGNATNASYFRNQLTGELGEKFHLLAFDFPGSGNSPFSDDPEKTYGIDGLTNILLAIIHSINKGCWLVGHSLGSNVALLAAQKNAANINGLFLSGPVLVDTTGEFPDAVFPNPALSLFFQEKLTSLEQDTLARAGLYNKDYDNVELIRNGLETTDPLLRNSIAAALANPLTYLGHIQFMLTTKLIVALVEGDNDPFINKAYMERLFIPTLWRNKIQLIENAGHSPHLENPTCINQLLEQFICQYQFSHENVSN